MSTVEAPVNGNPKPEIEALPAWKVIVEMVRFRPWYWFVDLISVVVYRTAWQLAPGFILRIFFDQLSGDAPVTLSIWAILALVFSTYLSRMIAGYGFYYADVPLFNEVNLLLRTNLMKHILKRPGASPLPDSAGEAVSRFRNDVFEIPLFTIWINDILTGIAVMVIAILIMFSISVPVTLLALVPVLIVGLIANAASKRVGEYRTASREATGAVTGFIGEFFGAVQAVKVAAVEEGVLDRFNSLNDTRKKLSLRERLFDEVLESIWRNTASLGTGAVLIFSGNAMRAGTFTIGDFSLFVFMLTSLSDLTTFVGMIVARYKKLGVSIQRMYRMMEGAPRQALVEWVDADLDKPSGTDTTSQPRRKLSKLSLRMRGQDTAGLASPPTAVRNDDTVSLRAGALGEQPAPNEAREPAPNEAREPAPNEARGSSPQDQSERQSDLSLRAKRSSLHTQKERQVFSDSSAQPAEAAQSQPASSHPLASPASLSLRADSAREPAPSEARGSSPQPPVLETCEVSGLSYHFPNSESGIENASFKLQRGTLTVITGRVGSGKTTLLRALLGLLPKDSGQVSWNGKNVDNPAEFFTPPQAAYTAQVPRLFSDTLRSNLLLGLDRSDEELLEAVQLAVFERDLAEMEQGLETLVGPRGVRLSGGQLQRAAAARMFLRKPELLVFDDLSSALDVETERLLWERLFARPDTTCLVVSHRKPVLKRADQILVMREGRIVAQGKFDELMSCCEEMRELVTEGNGKG